MIKSALSQINKCIFPHNPSTKHFFFNLFPADYKLKFALIVSGQCPRGVLLGLKMMRKKLEIFIPVTFVVNFDKLTWIKKLVNMGFVSDLLAFMSIERKKHVIMALGICSPF
ncbi:hypothetical protein BpHYR1_008879 [Brachionus plicatilis]|uniref:Uncharacterized protein n=1 Tax=Brachionus plicatilis TaxID=10195 RepID=A0A3M7P8M4_BRAPC|nr:hypothetical protein BpHYR1_008879 [Brachionus plicatilis]